MNTMQIMIELLREYIFKVGCACGNTGRLNTSVNISDVEYMIKIYEYLGCKELFVVLYIYYMVKTFNKEIDFTNLRKCF